MFTFLGHHDFHSHHDEFEYEDDDDGFDSGGDYDDNSINNAITDGCVAPLTMLLTIVIMYHKILSF